MPDEYVTRMEFSLWSQHVGETLGRIEETVRQLSFVHPDVFQLTISGLAERVARVERDQADAKARRWQLNLAIGVALLSAALGLADHFIR